MPSHCRRKTLAATEWHNLYSFFLGCGATKSKNPHLPVAIHQTQLGAWRNEADR
jgi:hypothetical protein